MADIKVNEVRQVGRSGRAYDYEGEDGRLRRLVVGRFEADDSVVGLYLFDHEGTTTWGRPNFNFGAWIKRDGFGYYYSSFFSLRPARGKTELKGMDLDPRRGELAGSAPVVADHVADLLDGKVGAERSAAAA